MTSVNQRLLLDADANTGAKLNILTVGIYAAEGRGSVSMSMSIFNAEH